MNRREAIVSATTGLVALVSAASAQERQNSPAFKEHFTATTFKGQRITIDNRSFVNCVFSDCILVYSGEPLEMTGNKLTGTHFLLTGAAQRTAYLLQEIGRSVHVELAPPDNAI